MTTLLEQSYIAALGAMTSAPGRLVNRAVFEAGERKADAGDVGADRLLAHLKAASLNDPLRKALHFAVSGWDVVASEEPWTKSTLARSAERRSHVYELLAIGEPLKALFDDIFPRDAERTVVISDTFEPWYSEAVVAERGSFYFDAYRKYLQAKNWSAAAVASLDEATTDVVSRLSDPRRAEARRAKGLVVGYVQSGKTANFAGVIAKSIDAGYRMIIVLAGTIDVLRTQTQRRLDMEMVGRENILRGLDAKDPEVMARADYQADPDWEKFLSFGFLPSSKNLPDIIRLTTADDDYERLKTGILALETEKRDKTKPLWAVENLAQANARLIIVKKNKTKLESLVSDLKSLQTPLHEIPTLIIDDESDQASLNTTDPKKWADGKPERSAINGAISQLLSMLQRAQYVGYTATPFANVFVDPSDGADIFPKDFLISLQRPPGYMGVADFHDIDTEIPLERRSYAKSNEKALIRSVVDGVNDQEERARLDEAVDAFVLTAALKLYRLSKGQGEFRHHTMLVHVSTKQIDHADIADDICAIWKMGAFTAASGSARLKTLYEDDFLKVSTARAGEYAVPASFEELKPFIGEAVSRIMEHNNPTIIVNGDDKLAQEDVDFDRRSVWRILVGGAKLSRGFTVEGLTISYYRRKTKQADTLLQMGRWFGFREGYRDLVRLYIGRAEPDGKKGETLDLYEAFGALVEDEEAFREQLRQYAEVVDGEPLLTPKDIPPLVSQHLPWLKPAARNKMFNAVLVTRRTTGSLVIPTGYPTESAKTAQNYKAVAPLLQAANQKVNLVIPPDDTTDESDFDAWIGEVDTPTFVSAIDAIEWVSDDYYAPDKAFLREIGDKVTRWVVIAPQMRTETQMRELPDIGPRSVFKRKPKPPTKKLWGEPTDRKHRPAAQFLAGALGDYGDAILRPWRQAKTGALLIYPMAPDPKNIAASPARGEVTLAVAWITPKSAQGRNRVVHFVARDSGQRSEPIIPAKDG